MSIRTNPKKAVSWLQRRLTTTTNSEKDESLRAKLDKLKSELHNIEDLFSTVKKNEEELLDTLTLVDALLRDVNIKNFEKIANRILQIQKPETSSQEPQQAEGKKKSVEEDVPSGEKLKDLKTELNNVKNSKELRYALTDLANHLRSFETKNSAEDDSQSETKVSNLSSQKTQEENRVKLEGLVWEAICKTIKHSSQKLQPVDKVTKAEASQKSKDEDKSERVHTTLPLSQDRKNELVDRVMKRIQVSYENLKLCSRLCLLSLSIFPEHAVMKKRHTIYWWIGEGFVKKTEQKTAEAVGEDVFDELLSCHLIVPHGNGKCPIVNKFKMNPWTRHMLVSSVLRENDQMFGFYSQVKPSSESNDMKHACLVLDQQKIKIIDGDVLGSKNWRTVFNVGTSYLNFGSKWMDKANKLMVLQLGRWQDSPSHHIEVESGEFLKDLKAQKHLKYVSLRGISRISHLPPSIVELVSLEILDLKACHNLETLPNDIASLKRLTHLDVSQCYLLESMPKGIEKLIDLQVLKGFVIGSSSKTPCRISDLAKLKKLTRLSIHIGSEAVIQGKEFEGLKDLSAVKRLKISWGVTRYKDFKINLPQNLDKLDLEGFPGEKIPEWLKPSKLPKELKKLYIKGGLLDSMDHGESGRRCRVEIVRLRYLDHLKKDPDLQLLFPSLRYAEKRQVLKRSYEWSIEEKGESTSMS